MHKKSLKAYFIWDGSSNFSPIFYRFCEIFSQNVHELELDLFNLSRSNFNIPVEMPYATSYMLAIAIIALSVTVWKLCKYELPNVLDLYHWSWKWMSRTLTTKKYLRGLIYTKTENNDMREREQEWATDRDHRERENRETTRERKRDIERVRNTHTHKQRERERDIHIWRHVGLKTNTHTRQQFWH